MGLFKLAIDNDIENHQRLQKNLATVGGVAAGGIYGALAGSITPKKYYKAKQALDRAETGFTTITQVKKPFQIFRKKESAISTIHVNKDRVEKLRKVVDNFKKYQKAKIAGGALVGATALGYGFRKLQDSQNKYEKAILGK